MATRAFAIGYSQPLRFVCCQLLNGDVMMRWATAFCHVWAVIGCDCATWPALWAHQPQFVWKLPGTNLSETYWWGFVSRHTCLLMWEGDRVSEMRWYGESDVETLMTTRSDGVGRVILGFNETVYVIEAQMNTMTRDRTPKWYCTRQKMKGNWNKKSSTHHVQRSSFLQTIASHSAISLRNPHSHRRSATKRQNTSSRGYKQYSINEQKCRSN